MRNELKKAVEWFQSLITKSKQTGHPSINTLRGKLVFMVYDPKLKNTLPYYDRYPLIFVISVQRNTILGINVHYLDQRYRRTLLNALVRFGIDDTDEDAAIKFGYPDVAGFVKEPLVRVCIKRYYIRKIENWLLIPSDQWEKMTFLPLQRFQKKSASYVWRESLRKVRGTE